METKRTSKDHSLEWRRAQTRRMLRTVLKMLSLSRGCFRHYCFMQSVSNVTDHLQRSTNLISFSSVKSNIVARPE